MSSRDRTQEVSQKIRSFAELPEGWHYAGSIGATEAAVDAAFAVNTLMSDFRARNVEVFPCVDGGVLLHGYKGTDVLEIQCGPDGRFHLMHEREDEIVGEREAASIDEIERYMGELEWVPSNSYVFSTQCTTARNSDALPAPHSNRPPRIVESLHSKSHAEFVAVARNANISIRSTMTGTMIRSSFGGSKQAHCQRIAV